MLSHYYTIKGYGEYEITIQKSRFITYVNRAESEQEAQQFITEIKKKNHSANHNCSAYMIGETNEIQKANDDGEPSGTAGVPMLEVLKKRNLKDTVVVVTRYFGGIKLGTGGLIRAYGKSASDGITATGIVERKLTKMMKTTVEYTWLGKIENELRQSAYTIKDIHYLDNVIFETFVEAEQTDAFSGWITELTNGQAVITEGDLLYQEFEV